MVENRVTEEVLLDPLINRTGNVWLVFVEGELHDMLYGYRLDGTFATLYGMDPYAKVMTC
jgi:isoamylase